MIRLKRKINGILYIHLYFWKSWNSLFVGDRALLERPLVANHEINPEMDIHKPEICWLIKGIGIVAQSINLKSKKF